MKSSLSCEDGRHLTTTIGTARIAVAKQPGHMTSYFETALLSDRVLCPACHNPRSTCSQPVKLRSNRKKTPKKIRSRA